MTALPHWLFCIGALLALFLGRSVDAQELPDQSRSGFTDHAEKLRQDAIFKFKSQVVIPNSPSPLNVSGRYPWKNGVVTTVFWIGRAPKGAAGHLASAWDQKWAESYGGYDNPKREARRDFIPANFVPRQNPFYISLPYNDIANGVTRPEARLVIPWFKEDFVREGKSICRDRWIAVRNSAGRVCYGQWSDCGPFHTDHWQYVFGNEKPRPNANQGAGLNVSPAIRDYLGFEGTNVTDWKFVDFKDVPRGPWSLYGDNNAFVRPTSPSSKPERAPSPSRSAPTVAPTNVN